MEEETNEPEEDEFEEDETPLTTKLLSALLFVICIFGATIVAWIAVPTAWHLSNVPVCHVKCWTSPYGYECDRCKEDGTIDRATHKAATVRRVREVSIADMHEGEEGYTLPWGLAVDENHRFWINSKYTVGDKGGHRSVLIRKGKDCITVLDDAGERFGHQSSETPNWYDMKGCG